MFKVNNRNTRKRRKIRPKLTIKTPGCRPIETLEKGMKYVQSLQ